MKSVKIKTLVLLFYLVCTNAIANDGKSKEELALEYLVLTKTVEKIRSNIEIGLEEPAADEETISVEKNKALLKHIMDMDIFTTPFIQIISESFTTEELFEINKFYKTKSGAALIENSRKIELEMNKVIQRNLQQLMNVLEERN